MDKQLEATMRLDMQILKYQGESQMNYEGRLIYSGIAEWIRYIILDETGLSEGVQSKAYVLRRVRSLIDNFVKSVPSAKDWLIPDKGDEDNISDTISSIRDAMTVSGELLEVDENNNLELPLFQTITLNDNCSRITGLNHEKIISRYVGISRIIPSVDSDNGTYIWNTLPVDEMLLNIFNSAKFTECSNVEDYEFFNPLSKKIPSNSWSTHPIREQGHLLARNSSFNGLHEYFAFIHEKDSYSYYKFPDVMNKEKEERRVLLGLRYEYQNPMVAYYEDKDSVVLLHLHCRLPLSIEGIIKTFSWPLHNISDFQNFVIPIYLWNNIKNLLECDLGILLTKEN